MTGIYSITNNITGDLYIGQSCDIERRWMEHRTPKNIAKDSPLYIAIRKYGLENFSFEVIQECKVDELDSLEIRYIRELNPSYNISLGGKGFLGHTVSEEQRALLSRYAKEQWNRKTDKERAYIMSHCLIGPRKGHPVSIETREKLRQCNIGKKMSEETKKKISTANSRSLKGNANRKRAILAINLETFEVEIFPMIICAAQYIKTNKSHLNHVLKKAKPVVKNWYVTYLRSVETNSDECNYVGPWMRIGSKRAASANTDEDIVHAAEMENQQTQHDRGAIQLAIRSGVFKSINVTDIREGEMKSRNILTGDIQFEEVPGRESKKIVGYAAYFALTNGFSKTLYMTVEEVDAHAKRYSQTYKSKYEKVRATSKWTTDFHAMSKKTVLKLLLSKYAPLSVEMRDAIKYDQSVIRENGEPDYVDGVDIQDEAVVETVEEQKKEMKEKNSKEAGTLL